MNIPDVRVLVGKQFNISEADARSPVNLSAADQIRLADYTFAYVAEHPEQFDANQVAIAKKWVASWGINTPLLDTSFDWGMLASEVGNNAVKLGESVASVGQGVMSTLNMTKWLIPVAVVILVGIYLYKTFKK